MFKIAYNYVEDNKTSECKMSDNFETFEQARNELYLIFTNLMKNNIDKINYLRFNECTLTMECTANIDNKVYQYLYRIV